MNLRREFLSGLAASALLLATGCASLQPAVDPAIVKTLAPTGTLRVGVYAGSPTSLVRQAQTGDKAGVAFELGGALGRQLGVPVQVTEFSKLADVLEKLKAGEIDFTFTNATEVRARDMDFTPPLVQLELGYLVPPTSRLTQIDEMDRAGVRVGVAQGRSSQGVLTRQFKSAAVVAAPSIQDAQDMLRRGQLDAFATNKGILFEMSDSLPGHRVLADRWGMENLAMAIPKQRESALPFLRQFAQDARHSGLLAGIVTRAGLRGTAPP